MPKPRTLIITVTTPDDSAKTQRINVDFSFDPPLGASEPSFLAAFAEGVIKRFPTVGGAKPRVIPTTEASLN